MVTTTQTASPKIYVLLWLINIIVCHAYLEAILEKKWSSRILLCLSHHIPQRSSIFFFLLIQASVINTIQNINQWGISTLTDFYWTSFQTIKFIGYNFDPEKLKVVNILSPKLRLNPHPPFFLYDSNHKILLLFSFKNVCEKKICFSKIVPISSILESMSLSNIIWHRHKEIKIQTCTWQFLCSLI